jgi:hypothetical protein
LSRPEFAWRALRHRNGEAVFSEQWHAQVVAVVELLVGEGKIDPEDWAQTLGAELDRRASEGAADTDATYYSAFLGALERILDKNRVAVQAEVDRRENDWRNAYLSTPHGKPVILSN